MTKAVSVVVMITVLVIMALAVLSMGVDTKDSFSGFLMDIIGGFDV